MGAEELELPPLDDHYADESRAALHHLERRLFEDEPRGRGRRGGRLVPLRRRRARRGRAGRRRACSQLLRDGVEPGDVAVVFREPDALLVAARAGLRRLRDPVLDRPHAAVRPHRHRPRPARADPRRRRPAAPPRTCSPTCARPGCSACRAAPTASRPRCAATARTPPPTRASAGSATTGRSTSSTGSPARATRRPSSTELEARLARLFAAPYERTATVLSGPQLEEARALSAAQRALAELRAVLGDRRRRRAAACSAMLEQLEVHLGETPQPDRVQVATPEAIRARRFEVGVRLRPPGGGVPARGVAGAVPRRRGPPRDRHARAASCCRCARTGSTASATSSTSAPRAPSGCWCSARARATRRATRRRSPTSWTTCATCSRTAPRSAPARSRTSPGAPRTRPRRPNGTAPTPPPARARPLPGPAPLSAEPLLEQLAARDAVAARALENFADCPVKWLVEDLLRPDELVPDPEAMVRGSYAHEVLSPHLRPAARGDRRPARDPRQPRAAPSASCSRSCASAAHRSSSRRSRRACAPRRAGSSSTCSASCARRPTRTAASRPIELERELRLRGQRAGRARRRPARARPDRPRGRARRHGARDRLQDRQEGRPLQGASWEPENRFQAALYMLVVEKLLGLRAAGGVYVALGSDDPRPRGMVAKDVDELGERWFSERPARPRGLPGRSWTGRSSGSARPTRSCAAAS